jgi:PAS domain S-box-containing protein
MTPERATESLETLAAILDVAIIGLDAHGRVDLWNPGAADIFGWSAEETLGESVPKGLGVLQGITSEVCFERAAPVRTKQGLSLDIEFRLAHRPSGGVLLIAEAGARIQAEARLREFLEAAPDAIIEVDHHGRIVMLNRVTEQLFGYQREELLGAPIETLMPAATRERHVGHRSGYVAEPGTRPMGLGMTLAAQRKDGSEFPVEISLSPIRSSDSFSVMAIVRDVTERRVFEEQIRKANLELEARNREIENANQLKSEFLASMSHELRTPLHTIIGFTELLEEESQGPLNEAQKRFAGHVHRDSVHLLELINDILDLSKIEANRLELRIESFDLGDVVREAFQGIIPAAGAKDIILEDRVEGQAFILADRVRVREIMTNLLSNAVKFTPRGGRVWVKAFGAIDEFISVSVSDTGIGIAPGDQSAIFDRFRQVGLTTSGVRQGTGLGLAIVKSLVELHGGSVSVDSTPGQGSVFTFTLPRDPDRRRVQPIVLIVEDEPGGRELLASYLEPLGIRTMFAGTADEGLAIARRIRPDAITLDLLMPGRTGWLVLDKLRASPDTREIPVFVVSVMDDDGEALARGAAAYLQKPLSKEVLLKALREHASVPPAGLERHPDGKQF